MFKPHVSKNLEQIQKESSGAIIRTFEAKDIKSERNKSYHPPSLLNSKRSEHEIPQRDQKFSIDPLLRGLFKNDDELEKKILTEVNERLALLSEEVTLKAQEEGYRIGYEAGKNEAHSKFSEESEERLGHLDSVLQQFDGLKKEIYDHQEKFLIHLFFKLSKVILKKEILSDPDFIKRTLFSVVDEMGFKEVLKIWISPNNVELLKSFQPLFFEKSSQLKNFSIEVQEQFKDQDLVIETDWNRMDASFDTQIERVYERMLLKTSELQEKDSHDRV